MFNIGMMELLLVLVVAFLVVGPKDLPKVARWIARQVKNIRKVVNEIKKETGWDEFSKELRDTTNDIKRTVKEADISEDINMVAQDVRHSVENVQREVQGVADEVKKVNEDLK